jgi:hypothetical protein
MTSSSTRKNNQSTAPHKQSKRPKPSTPAAPRKRTKLSQVQNPSPEREKQSPEQEEDETSDEDRDYDDELVEDPGSPSESSGDDEETASQQAKKAIARPKPKAPPAFTPPGQPNVELFDSRDDRVSTTKTRTPKNVEDLVQPTPDGILSIAVEATKPLATRYALFEAPFPAGDVKATHIARWWKQAVAEQQPELRNTEVPKIFSTTVSGS